MNNLIIIFILVLFYFMAFYLQVYTLLIFINSFNLLVSIASVSKFNLVDLFLFFYTLVIILFLIIIFITLIFFYSFLFNKVGKRHIPTPKKRSKLLLYVHNPIFNFDLVWGTSERKHKAEKNLYLSKFKYMNLKDHMFLNLIIIQDSVCLEDFFHICSTNPSLRVKDLWEMSDEKVILTNNKNGKKDCWFIDEKSRSFISSYKLLAYFQTYGSLSKGFPGCRRDIFLFSYINLIKKVSDNPYICLSDSDNFIREIKIYFETLLFHLQVGERTANGSGVVDTDGGRFTIKSIIIEIKGLDLRFYTNLNYNTYINSINKMRTLKYDQNIKELKEVSKNILIFFYILKKGEIKDLIIFLDIFNFDIYNSSLIDFSKYTVLVLENVNLIISSGGGLKSSEHFNNFLNSSFKLLPKKSDKSFNKKSNFKEICVFESKILDYSQYIMIKGDINMLNRLDRIWNLKSSYYKDVPINSKTFYNLSIYSKISVVDFINSYNGILIIDWKLLLYKHNYITHFRITLFELSINFLKSLRIKQLSNNPININLMLEYYKFFFDFLNFVSKERQKQILLGFSINLRNPIIDSFLIEYFKSNIINRNIRVNLNIDICEIYFNIDKISQSLRKIEDYQKMFILDIQDRLLILKELEEFTFILVEYYISLFGEDSFLILLKDLNKNFYLPLSDSLEDRISFFKRFSKFLIFIIVNRDESDF